MKVYQLRMIPEYLIADAGDYQEVWDLAAQPSSLHATRAGAKEAAAKQLADFVSLTGESEEGEPLKIEWDGDAGSFESISGTVTFLINRTTVR